MPERVGPASILQMAATHLQHRSLESLNVYTGAGAPNPVVKVNAAGNAVHGRDIQIKLNGSIIHTQPLNYYDYAKIVAPATIAQISSGSANIEVANIGTEANDRMVIAMTELVYPSVFNCNGESELSFELPASAAGNYLEIAGFNYNAVVPVLYDLTNGKRYVIDITGNPLIVKVALEPSASSRKLVLASDTPTVITHIASLTQRNFINFGVAANQGDYIIISHPNLTNGANGTNPINDYKNYRSSSQGGGYNAKIYMIDELVDQFALGHQEKSFVNKEFPEMGESQLCVTIKKCFTDR